MGNVIPLFKKGEPPPEPEKPVDLREILTEELDESMHDVAHHMGQLWEHDTVAGLLGEIAYIKREVARWPDAQS